MRQKDPILKDFYNDMNQHGNAEYKRVGGRYVIELESMPSGWQVTVWEAVKEGSTYVDPENNDNRYFWDAVGREEFSDYDAGKEIFSELTTRSDLQRFCEQNPYNGPRTPYRERSTDN